MRGSSMRSLRWRAVVSAGALWALVYNYLWGIAWFAFMRDEWTRAAATLRRPMPWTAEIWFGWVTLTLPLGLLVAAYAGSQPRPPARSALYASSLMGLLMTAGMCGWALDQHYAPRVFVLDSLVNVAALLVAGLVAGWSQPDPAPSAA